MRYLFLIVLTCVALESKAQNLVPNPSFEEYDECPFSLGQFHYVEQWYNPTYAFPAYFNGCANGSPCDQTFGVPCNNIGYQMAHSGQAYGDITLWDSLPSPIPNYRSYIAAKLIAPLEADTLYCAEMFLSLSGNIWGRSVNKIGFYFSVDSIYDHQKDTLSFLPQIKSNPDSLLIDTLDWTKIEGTFVAQGGEQYIVIGNFHPNSQTIASGQSLFPDSDYFIDDVSVMKCSDVTSSNALVAAPADLQLYPNPATDIIRYQSSATAVRISIYDAIGKEITIQPTQNHQVDISRLSPGVYVFELVTAQQRFRQRFVKM